MTQLTSDIVSQFPGSSNYISSSRTALALSALIVCECIVWGSGSSTLVIFENFPVFYFPFSEVEAITFSSFFMKLVMSVVPL